MANKSLIKFFENGLSPFQLSLKRQGKCLTCGVDLDKSDELVKELHDITGLCVKHLKAYRGYMLDKVASENISPAERVVFESIAFIK